MNLMICKDYDELSKATARIITEQINEKSNTILGLATGGTPVGTYKELVETYQAGKVDFSKVITFNLDEYFGLEKDNAQSYYYYMHNNLFNHINIPPANIHIPNGAPKSVEEECKTYDNLIEKLGGIDLQILGIGPNGHIGFNEPEEELIAKTHLTKLTEETIRANSRFFSNPDEVPTHAITMGIGTIMRAKKIILLVSGKSKAEILKKLLRDRITTNIPASLLHLHNNTTIIADEEAAYLLNR